MRLDKTPSPQSTNNNFPEKGEYQGIKYRFDGDAVVLTASNGQEVQFAPQYNVLELPQDVIETAHARGVYDTNIFGIGPIFPAQRAEPNKHLDRDSRRDNQYSPYAESQVDAKKMWGISWDEYHKLWGIASSVLKKRHSP